MAFTAILTGTGRNCTLTNGTSVITSANMAGIVVGSTVQGTGIPTGTRVGSISGSNINLVNASGVSVNVTANGIQSIIFSSVLGSVLTIVLNANGDLATWQNVFNAGFGTLLGTKNLFFAGALQVNFGQIVAGATFNHQDWTVEFGDTGRLQFDSGLLLGRHLGGYDTAGTLEVKGAGPTFIFNPGASNPPGGYSLFTNTGGLLTQGGTIKMHDLRIIVRAGSSANRSPAFTSVRDLMNVENLILDYSESTGTNASIGCGYGTILNPKIIFANSGLTRTNTTSIGNIIGLQFLGFFTDTPQAKFAIPNNYVMEEFSPQITNTQFLAGFQNNSTETFANINLSSPGWGLNDLKTKYQRYGGPNTINFPRKVSFEFNDSVASNLTGVTLYIKSGSINIINAVQSGDYNANTQALVLAWTSNIASYRLANTITDTISQVAQIRKYGYIQQTTSYSLNTSSYSQPFFMLTDTSLNGISEATASAINTVGINWTTKTITPTANLTYDQINARIAWELAQTANSAQSDPRTISGSNLNLASGWTLVVNNGITISVGSNITYLYCPTITLNGTGKIIAVYATTSGTSTVLQLNTPSNGYSLCLYQGTTVKYFVSNQVAGSYYVYLSPSETGTYTLAGEKYGYKRTQDTLSLTGGNVWYNFTDIEDVGITDTQSNVSAYTILSTTSQIYDATANFRLTQAGIILGQLCNRDGLFLDFGTYNVKMKDDNTAIISVATNTITYKSLVINETSKYTSMKTLKTWTITPTDNEQINVVIEDANGDSELTILGGDNMGYELWKIPTTTATDDYATGTLLTTLATNALPYRFIGINGFDIVGRDTSSGVRRRSSMAKGVYTQAFYVGNQIQLATDAPQLIENNQKLDEVIVKLDTNLPKVNRNVIKSSKLIPANEVF